MAGEGGGGPSPRIGARALHRALVASTVLGIVLPCATMLLKPAAEDFALWSAWRDAEPSRAAFFREHPALDLQRSLPFLADLAWHSTRETVFLEVYRAHAVLNALVLVGILAFRRRLLACLEPCAAWLSEREHRRARLTALAFVAGAILCYQAQTSLGFYFPGIGGWTYEGWRPTLRAELATEARPDPAGGRAPTAEERAFLELAVDRDAARWLPGEGFLSGRAMFLHYAAGEVLPGSYELTGMVFPRYFFGGHYERVSDPRVFGEVLRRTLGTWRERGGRFLLPARFAYPNHAVYHPIDYAGYPDPAGLERVSFWTLTVRVDGERRVELATAREELSVDVR